MKKILLTITATGLSACATSAADSRYGEMTERHDALLRGLDIPALAVAYRANLAALGSAADLARQADTLQGVLRDLDGVDIATLNPCEKIDHSRRTWLARVDLERARLGGRYLALDPEEADERGIWHQPLGSEWYALALRRWLGSDIGPDELFAFGELQLAASRKEYARIVARLGFAGDTEGLKAYLDSAEFFASDDATILAHYRRLQERVAERLPELFLDDYGVPPADIKRSDLGESFAVPGYYNSAEGTFYYNVLTERYDLRQADWLLLHEATPGHHLQVSAHGQARVCPNTEVPLAFPAFVEGWAAYVETIGAELGVYETDAAALSAV